MKVGLKIKLKVQKVDENRLFSTFSAWKTAWQTVSDWAFDAKSTSQMLAHQSTYRKVRDEVPDLPANLVQAARTDALAKLRSAKSNRHKLDKAPQIKKAALRYDTRTCTVRGNQMTLAVCGGHRIKVSFDEYQRFTEFRQKFKMLSPCVFYQNGVFYATFIFDIPDVPTNNRKVIGIDVGQRNFVATSDGRLFKGKSLNRLRRKTKFLKRKLQTRGTKSSRKHLRSLMTKERRQSDDAVHCLSKQILTGTKADHIAVEKLKLPKAKGHGKKAKNRRRYAVPIGKLFVFLKYKASRYGKAIVEVNPYRTSQIDCRGLKDGIRDNGRYIGADGKILNADINAACNIAWKAVAQYGLNNPFVAFGYERQADVTQPIAFKSSVHLGSCNSLAS